MATLSCRKFADYLSRKSEHLDTEIIKDITPVSGWIGHVRTGKFSAEDGVSHTYDRFTRVMPNLSNAWTDVDNQSCIGTPCDPDETTIGFGYVRDSYKLQEAHYDTDLFCFDLIMSADKAVEQFQFIIGSILRPATNIIVSDRLRTEAFRICARHWYAGGDFMTTAGGEFTYTSSGNLTNIVPSTLPTSKLTNRMLQRRVEPQVLLGALGEQPFNSQPMLELVLDAATLDELMHDSTVADHWRFEKWEVGGQFYKYGWLGRVGNYAARVDPHQMRFQLAEDGVTLNRVFPYINIAATQGIRGVDNPAYENAHFVVHYIWHREGMVNKVLDTRQINPMMPFASRDFGGKWQFVTQGLVCKNVNNAGETILSPVDNRRGNKGQFISDHKMATKKEHNEWCEAILALREPACIINVPTCSATPEYVEQDYSSSNDLCEADLT